ncbi:MAG: SUF system NifU family Fe-S cluster assembly protein [SAR202 cluster bacterium]|nr:SUF system NifU family Fe-S cluster assembly protein [SAR202 cluster bacterium]
MARNARNELDDLYGEVILDHCRNPRFHDVVEPAGLRADGVNPFCGDEVHVQIALAGGRAARVGVQSQGCSINRASASMMAGAIHGKTIPEIEALASAFRAMIRGESSGNGLGDLDAMAGVREFPVRIKCALLPWSTLEDAVGG